MLYGYALQNDNYENQVNYLKARNLKAAIARRGRAMARNSQR